MKKTVIISSILILGTFFTVAVSQPSGVVPYISNFMRTVLRQQNASTARSTLGVKDANNTAFSSHWNGKTTEIPSMNTVYGIVHTYDPNLKGKVHNVDPNLFYSTGQSRKIVQDIVGGMLTGTQTHIVVQYHNDANNISFVAEPGGGGIGEGVAEANAVDTHSIQLRIQNGNFTADLNNVQDWHSKTITMPKRTKNTEHSWALYIEDVNKVHDANVPIIIDPNISAALTISKVEIVCNKDPTTEIDWDLYYGTVGVGYTGQTLIGVIDTTAGAANIKSFTNTHVAAFKKIYIRMAAACDKDLYVNIKIFWTYD